MNRSLLLMLLPFAAIGTPAVAAPEAPVPTLASEVSIEPDPTADDLYLCTAVLRDLENDEVLAAPTVRFRAGESATVVSELPSGWRFEVEVEVDAAGGSAGWSSELRDGDEVLSRQSGAVRLAD